MEPGIHQIREAQSRFAGIIPQSPLVHSGYFSRLFGADIFLKLENLQETGSFKVRGAFNRLLQLGESEREKGVIAASAGNHAQGVAWAATRLGIGSTIVMPEDAPLRKRVAVKDYGAKVILFGTHYSESRAHAADLSRSSGKILIPGFDDPYVIAGQGTIGLEISEFLEGDTAVIVSVGGGGLISGIAAAVKAIKPSARMIGVQSKSCPSMIRSLEEGFPVSVDVQSTIADGIAVNRPGEMNFSMVRKTVDELIGVEEESIAGAVLNLLEKANVVAEGAGAAPLAALMEGHALGKASRYILVISGGNIEVNTIDRILHRGSIKMGRVSQIEVNVMDVPGALWKLLGIIAREKANVLHIFHDRLDPRNPIEVSRVKLSLETRGHDHAGEILDRLRDAGYPVKQVR
ncbi:MAG: threonine ammonia-lyase [Pseudomonadota bacterium]